MATELLSGKVKTVILKSVLYCDSIYIVLDRKLVIRLGKKPTLNGNELDFNEAFDYKTTLKFYNLFFKGYIGDNWIFQNIEFLIDRDRVTPNGRPLAPDGGEPTESNDSQGTRALVIIVSEPSVDVEISFGSEYMVEEFSKSGGLFR